MSRGRGGGVFFWLDFLSDKDITIFPVLFLESPEREVDFLGGRRRYLSLVEEREIREVLFH
jgi:hypothetical protein